MKTVLLPISALVISGLTLSAKPNLLLITVDDMSCDSVGVFGCKLEGTTPHRSEERRVGKECER